MSYRLYLSTSGIGYWNRFVQSPEYQHLQPEERPITEDELSEHSSGDDLWMALRDRNQGKSISVIQNIWVFLFTN